MTKKISRHAATSQPAPSLSDVPPVDTNVISALAPAKRPGSIELAEWLDRASAQLFLSVISAAEVRSGIAKAAREGATTKAQRLKEWWESIEYLYAQKLLPFDLSCAHAAGQILMTLVPTNPDLRILR